MKFCLEAYFFIFIICFFVEQGERAQQSAMEFHIDISMQARRR
jgi:hypothetical protein